MKPDPLAPLFARFSCRSFHPDPIPEADLRRLLEAMQHAPSAGNMQPWQFYVVRSAEIRDGLAKAAFGQRFVAQAPIAIVVCADAERSASRYKDRGRLLYVLQDTAAATENLLIAAAGLGYATCWVGAFDEERAAAVLDLPASLRPVAIVPVGRPAAEPASPDRRPLQDLVRWM